MRPLRDRVTRLGRTPNLPTRTVRMLMCWEEDGRQLEVWWQVVTGGAYVWLEAPWGRRHVRGRYIPGDGRSGVSRGEAEALAMKYLKSALGGKNAVAVDSKNSDPWLEAFAPAVTEFVTLTKGVDGKQRQTSSLTVFYEEGLCKVCLTERDYDQSLWASGPTLKEALEALELRLTAPVVEWRRKKTPPQNRGAKHK